MKDLFKHSNGLKPKKGRILLSEPFLEDDYFKRSVILLCDYNEEGAFGFVLNNYITIRLNELVEDVAEFDTTLSLGGPVNTNNLYYIHTLGDKLPGASELMEGIHIGGDFDLLKQFIAEGKVKPSQVKFFLGYSGWSANQLDEELEDNSWIVTDSDSNIIMQEENEKLWENTLKQMGGKFKIISDFPKDPNLN